MGNKTERHLQVSIIAPEYLSFWGSVSFSYFLILNFRAQSWIGMFLFLIWSDLVPKKWKKGYYKLERVVGAILIFTWIIK